MSLSPESIFTTGVIAINDQNFRKAIQLLNQVLAQNPHHSPSYYNLGLAYSRLGNLTQAVKHYRKAINLEPHYAKALYGLACLYFDHNQDKLAAKYFKEALKHNPNLPDAYACLGIMADNTQQPELALKYYHQGLAVTPNNPVLLACNLVLAYKLHDYANVSQLSRISSLSIKHQLSLNQKPGPTPFISLYTCSNARENLEVAKWHSQHLTSLIPKNTHSAFAPPTSPPIHLGYLSYDFCDHVIGRLTRNLFRHHSDHFQVHLYSLNPPDSSLIYQQFTNLPLFTDVSALSSPQVAAKIRADHIDILIDLTCHTKGGHPEICALRPAPIQINYLGFPGSSGADFYDYILGDSVLIPPDHERFYTEKILRLPHYLVTSYPTRKSIIVNPKSTFTFACLARPVKITRDTLLLWFDILRLVPGSLLQLQKENATAVANILNLARQQDIDPDRLTFQSTLPFAKYLKHLNRIDLALDSPHYNGGGTTADLLYAGVPVVTLAGHRYVERMGAAILTAAGLPELITHSRQDYINLAVSLATHPKKLEVLKNVMTKKVDLFNTQAWVQNFERGLNQIWQRYLKDLSPAHITIS